MGITRTFLVISKSRFYGGSIRIKKSKAIEDVY